MRIHIATDHAGLDFSVQLQQHLRDAGHDVVDHGPISYDPVDDYPAFCIRAAQAVVGLLSGLPGCPYYALRAHEEGAPERAQLPSFCAALRCTLRGLRKTLCAVPARRAGRERNDSRRCG